MAYAHKLPLNAHAGVSSRAIGLILGLNLYLQPYFMYAREKAEQAHLSLN